MDKRLRSVFAAVLLWFIPFLVHAQQQNYFPNRLIIKYQSDQQLQTIRSKKGIRPRSAVRQALSKQGAYTSSPLLKRSLQQVIQQRRLASAKEVQRIREVVFHTDINPVQLAAKISKMPGIAYAEPRYIRHTSLEVNDPNIGKFITEHNFEHAWDRTTGSRDVVIAIIDGGVGYTHVDLNDKLWINQQEVPPTVRPQADQDGDGTVTATEIRAYLQQNGEDYNRDGRIDLEDALDDDSAFMDGVDTDNNNFTDDLYGWDFWASGGFDGQVTMDNNPIHDGTDHGTHVAGIAAAETNNDTAIAGSGYNSSYMAVKTGGIPDDPNTPNIDESRSIGFGFNGMVYAANQGADILSCSWGGGSYSQAEQDVINLVTDMGSLVVAASGNSGRNPVDFPSGYDKVVSVGSVEPDQTIAFYSNYGYNLDVLATGTQILSLSYADTLATKTGTSMATPVVSGLAGLLKAEHPNWPPERIGQQIRGSATFIEDANQPAFHSLLGHGSIDAFRAVSTNLPGIKMLSHRFVDADGNKLKLGQPGSVHIRLTNLGNDASNLQLQLESLNEQGIQIESPSQTYGSLATGDTVEVAFDMTITTDFDLDRVPTLRLNYRDGSQQYEDFGILQYGNIMYDIMAANNIKTSFGSEGTIGFTDPLNGAGGIGFIPRQPDGSGGYQEGDNLLFEGGLMVEVNDELYDAVRDLDGVSRDFRPEQVFATKPNPDGDGITGSTRFVTKTDSTHQLNIDLQTYAFDDPSLSNVVFLKYTLQNPSSFLVMKNVYAGLFNDWDIGDDAGQNSISYSSSDSLLYVSEATSNSTQPVVAVAQLGPTSSVLAINNAAQVSSDSTSFGIYDGFTDEEKKVALKAGTQHTNASNTDVSAVVASGPYTLNPHAKVTVGFVYAFGDDVDELRSQIAEARSRNLFAVSPAGRAISEEVPPQTKLFQNYPNPFKERTQIRIDLQQTTDVTLTIFDVLGRKVRTLTDRQLQAGSHYISFNPENLSSGVYFARLTTDNGVQSIPMTFVK